MKVPLLSAIQGTENRYFGKLVRFPELSDLEETEHEEIAEVTMADDFSIREQPKRVENQNIPEEQKLATSTRAKETAIPHNEYQDTRDDYPQKHAAAIIDDNLRTFKRMMDHLIPTLPPPPRSPSTPDEMDDNREEEGPSFSTSVNRIKYLYELLFKQEKIKPMLSSEPWDLLVAMVHTPEGLELAQKETPTNLENLKKENKRLLSQQQQNWREREEEHNRMMNRNWNKDHEPTLYGNPTEMAPQWRQNQTMGYHHLEMPSPPIPLNTKQQITRSDDPSQLDTKKNVKCLAPFLEETFKGKAQSVQAHEAMSQPPTRQQLHNEA